MQETWQRQTEVTVTKLAHESAETVEMLLRSNELLPQVRGGWVLGR